MFVFVLMLMRMFPSNDCLLDVDWIWFQDVFDNMHWVRLWHAHFHGIWTVDWDGAIDRDGHRAINRNGYWAIDRNGYWAIDRDSHRAIHMNWYGEWNL